MIDVLKLLISCRLRVLAVDFQSSTPKPTPKPTSKKSIASTMSLTMMLSNQFNTYWNVLTTIGVVSLLARLGNCGIFIFERGNGNHKLSTKIVFWELKIH
jgi:hypothetical protein